MKVGEIGEKLAADYLAQEKFSILARNYRKKFGEIDIVAKKDGIIHFVEVKTSRYHAETAFLPEIRVNKRKIGNLKRICEAFISEKGIASDQLWQIDVISVILDVGNLVNSIKIFENAVFERRY